MKRNTISVVMATYNGKKYIREQLESIFNQTCLPDEIIIADDCSSDGTVDIVNRLSAPKNVKVISYVNSKNLGYIKNFKTAISKAKGDYIFLCDQDDIWEENKIEKTINVMEKEGAEVACTGFRLIDAKGDFIKDTSIYKSDPICGYEKWTKQVKKITIKRLAWGNFSPGCTYCFTRYIKETFNKIENVELSHDFQLLIIGAYHHAAIYIDEPLSRYRLHGANTIGMNKKELKRKRHFKPRLIRFMDELEKYEKTKRLFRTNIILYCRIPKIRSVIIHKLHLKNSIDLR